jgi:hypothetical protein
MKAVVDQTMALDRFVSAHPVPVAAAGWAGVKAALAKLEQSFGMR